MKTTKRMTRAQHMAESGLKLSWEEACMTVCIPDPDEVLYCMGLLPMSEQILTKGDETWTMEDQYWFGISNGFMFGANCHLVASAVIEEINSFCRKEKSDFDDITHGELDLEKARTVIARAMVVLLPHGYKCLFYSLKLRRQAKEANLPPENSSQDQIIASCLCRRCTR